MVKIISVLKSPSRLTLACFLLLVLSVRAFGHGLVSASAKVELRQSNLVELNIQFDLVTLLNHKTDAYSLPVLASLSDEQFGRLYAEVIKLFDQRLIVEVKDKPVTLHKRYPTRDQMMVLIMRQFIAQTLDVTAKNIPYTFSDRRYFQLAFFDFKLKNKADVEYLKITFPRELGDIYVTYSEPKSRETHSGEAWAFK